MRCPLCLGTGTITILEVGRSEDGQTLGSGTADGRPCPMGCKPQAPIVHVTGSTPLVGRERRLSKSKRKPADYEMPPESDGDLDAAWDAIREHYGLG